MVWNFWEKVSVRIEKEVDYCPILTLPKGTQSFILYCDASRVGLGYVLMNNVMHQELVWVMF